MTVAWRPWLPKGAVDDGTVNRLLADLAGHWSSKWLATGAARIDEERAVAAGARESVHWLVAEEGLAIGSTEVGAKALVGLVLDADLGSAVLSGSDGALIERVSKDLQDDLRVALARLFDLPRDAVWRSQSCAPSWVGAKAFSLAVSGRKAVIHMLVGGGLIVALRKSIIPRSADTRALEALATGLAPQPLSLSARLGQCDLTVCELSGLAQGDVLILDRASNQPLDLVIDGAAKPGRCLVEQDGERLLLRISTPLNG